MRRRLVAALVMAGMMLSSVFCSSGLVIGNSGQNPVIQIPANDVRWMKEKEHLFSRYSIKDVGSPESNTSNLREMILVLDVVKENVGQKDSFSAKEIPVTSYMTDTKTIAG